MKTQQQIEKFIETVENLIPKLEEKQLEYLRQGNEFGFNVMKGKVKERLIELNTVRWVLDDSTNDMEEVKSQANKHFEEFIDQAIEDSACADERRSLQYLLDEFKEQNND